MPELLKFHFTPVDAPRGDEVNVHAKASTQIQREVGALQERFGNQITDLVVYAGEHTVTVAISSLIEVCTMLKEELGFTYLADLAGVDRFTEDGPRFEVLYSLINISRGKRIRLKVEVEESRPVVPSIVGLFKAADWNERECFDMFGIRFDGHPDLRRMFMPEDFAYFPQRKEFPLLGVPGSLPLPPQSPEAGLTMDPFAAAHGSRPPRSFEEPARSDISDPDPS